MLEQVFVGTGILAWLSVLKNDADGALASLATFRDRAEEEAPNLTLNIDAFICRIKLYQGEDVSDWMKQAPDENAEFCTMERFRYLTKVRVYISLGKLEAAYCLLQQLLQLLPGETAALELCQMRGCKFFDCLKTLRADHMFNAAGILSGNFAVHTKKFQPTG